MSTTFNNARIELSKQIGDYWAGTTTGAGSSTTVVDTALKAKQNDWINLEAYDLITSGTYDTEERKISSLDNTSGTLTVLAHGGTIAGSVTYEVHRLASASDKRIALVAACREAYPYIHKQVRDESHVSGNWLKDGSFEVWTSSTNLTYWTETTSTVTQTTTAGLFKNGANSAALSASAGTLAQSITNQEDLKRLAGKEVTFTVQARCGTASALRISIADGTDTTYSDYLDQITGWTEDHEPLEVTATIADHPTSITFTIHYELTATTAYVDDARVISSYNPPIYIGELGLSKNTPRQVFVEPLDYYSGEPWVRIHNWTVDETNGLLFLPDNVQKDYRLRIIGTGYLDFLASGVASTLWTATIAIDQPQLDILIAQAIIYIYRTFSIPNFYTGDRKAYMEMMGFWDQELKKRIARAGMRLPALTTNWGT
jgi:hypothetical protein